MPIDASAVARVVGISTQFVDLRQGAVNYLPQRVAILAQGNTAETYATTKRQITSALEAAELYGFGSPIYHIAKQLFPVNGDGVGTIPVTVYPLEDEVASVAAAGDITPSGTQATLGSYSVNIGNIASTSFLIEAAATVADVITSMTAAINAVLDMPMLATDSTTVLDLAAKWKGVTGNDIEISIDGPTDGYVFAITQPTGGTTNPSIDDALTQVGEVWETLFINGLGADTTALDALALFNEARWLPVVRRPFMSFYGTTEATLATATALPDSRKTDRTNVQLVSPGSPDMPWSVAGRSIARIAVLANNNPPVDFARLQLTGLDAGTDAEQWDYAQRDVAVKAGSSTVLVRDGVIELSDTVTMYHPAGDPIPAYRYVVDIIKVMQIIYNWDLIFATAEWDGAPLIPDEQPTTNRAAKKPRLAVAAVNASTDNLALEAIISDPESTKASTSAVINPQNPKRLDISATFKLSGNTNIIDLTLNWGFFFGGA